MIVGHFIPATDDTMARGRSPEEKACFEALSPKETGGPGQSVYVLTPSGKVLGRLNGEWQPEPYVKMLREALEKWNAMDRKERLLQQAPAAKGAGSLHADLYPADGLVLQVFARDLPPDPRDLEDLSRPPFAYEKGGKWGSGNRDMAWFTKEEVKAMVPATPKPGARQPMPEKLARRLAKYHFMDLAIETRRPFTDGEVKKADLVLVVTGVEGDLVKFRIEGSTRAERTDPKAKVGSGFEATILGRAAYRVKDGKFVSFEVVAVGTRWGPRHAATVAKPEPPGLLGIAVRLSGAVPGDRLPPSGLSWQRGKYFD